MEISEFKKINYTELKNNDNTERAIGYSIINNVILVGRNCFYPNTLLYSDNEKLISPYDEKIMSLNKSSFYDNNIYDMQNVNISTNSNIINNPVFFFIYNFDNYYHFLYDTLPYLYTYLYLKNQYHDLKLLVNYPNKYKKDFYKFNTEFLEKIINLDDMIIHNECNIYSTLFVSTSLTHGGYSNNPPRSEIFDIYDIIKSNINISPNTTCYKKIYISRRTWINNDRSNIGTDYTTRRKMINEDILVKKLQELGFVEIFAENLSTDEKIYLFSNAECIVGSIGGGMANLLFCNKSTSSFIIVTPYFFDISYRFRYSLEGSHFTYFSDVLTFKTDNEIPLYCRVRIKETDKIGEIVDFFEGKYKINISDNDVAGFNNMVKYKNDLYDKTEFELIDNGLNSPYVIDIDKLVNMIIDKE